MYGDGGGRRYALQPVAIFSRELDLPALLENEMNKGKVLTDNDHLAEGSRRE